MPQQTSDATMPLSKGNSAVYISDSHFDFLTCLPSPLSSFPKQSKHFVIAAMANTHTPHVPMAGPMHSQASSSPSPGAEAGDELMEDAQPFVETAAGLKPQQPHTTTPPSDPPNIEEQTTIELVHGLSDLHKYLADMQPLMANVEHERESTFVPRPRAARSAQSWRRQSCRLRRHTANSSYQSSR